MSMGSSARGASDDQISQIPSWRYKGAHTNLDFANDSQTTQRLINDDPVSDIITIENLESFDFDFDISY